MGVASQTTVRSLDSQGNLRSTTTDLTMDATNYTANGLVLTAQQLGLSQVLYGDVAVKTVVAAGPVGGFLDCTNPVAPKLKLNNAAAEVGAVSLSGAIIEVTAYGYP